MERLQLPGSVLGAGDTAANMTGTKPLLSCGQCTFWGGQTDKTQQGYSRYMSWLVVGSATGGREGWIAKGAGGSGCVQRQAGCWSGFLVREGLTEQTPMGTRSPLAQRGAHAGRAVGKDCTQVRDWHRVNEGEGRRQSDQGGVPFSHSKNLALLLCGESWRSGRRGTHSDLD